MLVEDELSVLEVVRAMLKKLGYYVITAPSGREAIMAYRANSDNIALVISDVAMPTMGGDELLHILAEENPSLKMILMSGYPLQKLQKDPRYADVVVGWLHKPISLSDLSQALDMALSNNQPAQHNKHKELAIQK
ncbi:MAG: response regulator [Okeania sp. SIO3B3]|nr:response regulator [Okeania sp. SIO3B3]